MSKGGSAPQQPNYKELIPEQEASDLRKYDYMLAGQRASSTGPGGKSYWKQTPNIDQAGYDAALAKYNTDRQGIPDTVQEYFGDSGNNELGGYRAVANPALEKYKAPNIKDFTKTDWEFVQELSPENQAMYDSASGQLKQLVGEGFERPQLIDDAGGKYSQDLADAIYRRTTRYTQPEQDTARRALETRLAERGFQVGNAGYGAEMSRFDDRVMTADADAADRAQIQAAQQGLSEATFTNNSRLAGQNSKANIAALLASIRNGTLGGAPSQASFTTPTLPNVDILGAAQQDYSNQMQQYNAEVAQDNALFGSLLSLGSLGLGAYGAGLFGGGMGGAMDTALTTNAGFYGSGGALRNPSLLFRP